jgi:chromosome segregation ATPase
MAELRRSVETANSERAAIESKLHSIDAEVQTLRQQSRTATQRNEELTQTAKELQDVLRRQQTYVNNVVSRYREITDILRAPAAPAGSRDLGPDLVRAGSLISMTDEDLRAVRELNSRLALIQKRLLAAASRK